MRQTTDTHGRHRLASRSAVWAVVAAVSFACADDDDTSAARACDAEPEVLTTTQGTEFVRTPDTCFDGLPGWTFAPQYVELDGLRQAYIDEGPAEGEIVLLLHGQPQNRPKISRTPMPPFPRNSRRSSMDASSFWTRSSRCSAPVDSPLGPSTR